MDCVEFAALPPMYEKRMNLLGQLRIDTLEDTDRLGCVLAATLPVQVVIAVVGTLGAGKTRLTQAIANAAGVPEGTATSPTFTLIQTYEGQNGDHGRTINHVDAYRVNDSDEFLELGIEEIMDQPEWTIIEWADRVSDCIPEEALWLEIDLTETSTRSITFRGADVHWKATVDRIIAEFSKT